MFSNTTFYFNFFSLRHHASSFIYTQLTLIAVSFVFQGEQPMEENVPRTELQEIQLKMNQSTDEVRILINL